MSGSRPTHNAEFWLAQAAASLEEKFTIFDALVGNRNGAGWAQLFGQCHLCTQSLVWLFLQNVEEAIVANLENLRRLMHASTR